ncbi:hypothetical protein IMZ48_21835, partial [Candidatus Bathyarchaeota archaeon]|nr:hypothetical protein [Candidatus Bathyarchaeota archaeon]
MYLHHFFQLLVGYLFCFSRYALAAPSSNDPGTLDALGNPHDSAHNDKPLGDDTSISRNVRRKKPNDYLGSDKNAADLQCNDLGKNVYMMQEYVFDAIWEFCDEAIRQ